MLEKNKVLIIEDDRDMRQALNLRLRSNNYDTVFASDAVMALSIAKQEQPDLILLDLGLPGGDGFMVLSRLKDMARLASIPVIVVSARDPQKNKERALAAGAHAYFQKPAENKDLMVAIQDALFQ